MSDYWSDAAWGNAYDYDNSRTVKFHVTERIKHAAVTHKCTLCGGTIEVGYAYTRQVGMSVGDEKPWVLKEHDSCDDAYGP